MTQQEAIVRNNKIMQLRGITHRIKSLIPEDIRIRAGLSKQDIVDLHNTMMKIHKAMNDSTQYIHICNDCKINLDGKPFRNDAKPHFYTCNICNTEDFETETFRIKRDKLTKETQ